MSAQQKYIYQYAYLDGNSFSAVENNNLYNDERGGAEILQNYNHNSLNLSFKAGEHTARALSVLLANSEVGLILKPITHEDIISENFDVYDLVKIGNIGLTPNSHFYEVGGEFLSNEINNVDFLARQVISLAHNEGGDEGIEFATINDGTNTYIINPAILTNGICSFYYPTGNTEGAPLALVDLRNMSAFSIEFSGNSIPANFLSEYLNASCEMTITNAVSIMRIGDGAFSGSRFSNIIANFSGIRELGSGVQLARAGGTITTDNPLGLVAYDDLSIVITNEVQEINNLIIASDFFAAGSKKLLNDNCNALSHYRGDLTEIKNCTIVEDFADLTNLNMDEVIFDNCTFAVDQDFSANVESRTLNIKNCNQAATGTQEFTFTGFEGPINIENSFKSAEAIYLIDDAAAYALEIDNDSFINAVAVNSGSLNKVLTNENRSLTPELGAASFLRINNNNIVSFSGNSFLTTSGTILTITEITSIAFSSHQKWNLLNGTFSFANFALGADLYLYDNATKESYISQFILKSFNGFNQVIGGAVIFKILASQLLQILAVDKCFNSNGEMGYISIYNDLPTGFNYLQITRNETSFIFGDDPNLIILNDPDGLLKEAMRREYPEYLVV